MKTNNQLHREYVRGTAAQYPQDAVAHSEMMAIAESDREEKREWLKLALELEKERK